MAVDPTGNRMNLFNVFGTKPKAVTDKVKTEKTNEAAPVLSEPILKIAKKSGIDAIADVNKLAVSSTERLDENGAEMLALAGVKNKSYAYISDKPAYTQALNDIDAVFTGGNVRHFMQSGEMNALNELFDIA